MPASVTRHAERDIRHHFFGLTALVTAISGMASARLPSSTGGSRGTRERHHPTALGEQSPRPLEGTIDQLICVPEVGGQDAPKLRCR